MMIYRSRNFLLVLLFAALVACSPPEPPATIASTDPNGQTIILWHSAEGDSLAALLAQIDEFNATNPWGILVVPEYHGDEASLMNTLKTAIESGRAPDVVLALPLDAARLGEAVVPVEAYAADAGYGLSDADLADLYPATLDANRDPNRDQALTAS